MAVFSFAAGLVVRIDGVELTLHRKITDTLWQLENTRNRRIENYEHVELLRLYVRGRLTASGGTSVTQAGPANSKMSPQNTEIAKIRRAYAEGVFNVPNSRPALEKAILDIWTKIQAPQNPPSYTTVYRWKIRYMRAGRDFRVLVDNTARKGNRTRRYPSGAIRICEDAIRTKFLRREHNSIQATLDKAKHEVNQWNHEHLPCEHLPLPTRRLIKRLIDDIPEFDKYSARKGPTAARHYFRSVLGHRITQAPLERAEIDHTVLDLFVVDDQHYLPLGRPTVTICIDDYTRCILGLYVGFALPSYQSVAQCLKQCLKPKVDLQERFPQIVSEWPAHGTMRELVCDNGLEFHGTSLEQVCLSLGIEMHFAPRRQPWFKGKVERILGTLNRAIAHSAPGTTFRNIFEKGDYDPVKHAVVTLSALRLALWKWVADVYHQETHSSLQTTPNAMWMSSIKPEDIPVPDDSIQLDATLGRSLKRTLTHKGIEFEGLIYNSPELGDLRKREGANIEVDLRIDDNDIGSIWLIWPKTDVPYRVPALNSKYANGISLYQHKIFRNHQAKSQQAKPRPEGLLEAKEAISRILEEGLSRRNAKAGKRYARFSAASQSSPAKVTNQKQLTAVSTPSVADTIGESSLAGTDVAISSLVVGDIASPRNPEVPRPYYKPMVKRGYSSE